MLTRSLAVLCVVALPAFFLVFSAGAASQLATTRLRAELVRLLGRLSMAKVLYTARAHVTGGRQDGHGRSADCELDVRLRVPKEMGGTGGGTNPEEAAAQLVRDAHQVCPYSNATRGNIDVDLLIGGEPV